MPLESSVLVTSPILIHVTQRLGSLHIFFELRKLKSTLHARLATPPPPPPFFPLLILSNYTAVCFVKEDHLHYG